jgi:hypothetical protein
MAPSMLSAFQDGNARAGRPRRAYIASWHATALAVARNPVFRRRRRTRYRRGARNPGIGKGSFSGISLYIHGPDTFPGGLKEIFHKEHQDAKELPTHCMRVA